MKEAQNLILKYNLFKPKDIIGVACSGGVDSMSLLHYLNANKDIFNIEVVAINVDHSIREESFKDSLFVENYCKENNIKCYKFVVKAKEIALQNKVGIEEAARKARYGVFDTLLEKQVVNKIALAHHEQDQVETILLNLLRGSGLKGVSGMEVQRNNYIRPFLTTKKREIINYAYENQIPFVEDETNNNIEYSRNLLRNKILPLIRENWQGVDDNLLNFAKICKQDDDYINSTIDFDDVVIEDNTAKIPLFYFAYNESVINRILRYAFIKIKAIKDIETKHLNILKSLAKDGENGTKINLPNNVTAHKEYDYLTISIKEVKEKQNPIEFFTGKNIKFNNYTFSVKKTSKINLEEVNCHYIDASKLPKNVVWRTRKDGDMFEKFGGGNKKLKDYFIDKKVPSRIRNEIPVLASDKEVYVVLGYEISNKVKVDNLTTSAYKIEY